MEGNRNGVMTKLGDFGKWFWPAAENEAARSTGLSCFSVLGATLRWQSVVPCGT